MWTSTRGTPMSSLFLRGRVVVAAILAAVPAVESLDAQTRRSLEPREIAARAAPAVVGITALDAAGKPVAQGTGFTVSADGVLVTNFHVIERAATVRVELPEGRATGEVMLLAADPTHDVAVLQVAARTPRFLELGRDALLEVGDRVYVMGNPLGMERTFSDGLLSARRTVEGAAMLQVSAPISEGSSGGPVLDGAGRVVGVATATVTEGQNLNLATPARYVRPLLERRAEPRRFSAELVAHHAVPRPAAVSPRSAAAREDAWLAQPRQQLEGAARILERQGFRQVQPIRTGYAAPGAPVVVRLRLEEGQVYGVMGACDNDCTDVDLLVVDRDQGRLGADMESDDSPVVVFRAPYSGEFLVGVSVARCNAEVCGYAVGVVAK